MASDLDLLNIMCKRDNYDKFRGFVNTKAMRNEEPFKLLQAIDAYYQHHPEFDRASFRQYFFHVYFPDCKKESVKIYDSAIQHLTGAEDNAPAVLKKYKECLLQEEIVESIKHSKPMQDIHTLIGKELRELESLKLPEEIDNSLKSIIEYKKNQTGYEWRLQALNDALGKLTLGTLGIIASRPDSGKTSLLASEASFVASQLKDDQCILWLNNESRGQIILRRIYSAALNEPFETIEKHPARAQEQFKALGGHRIKVYDFHGKNTHTVERMIEEHKPSLLILDMIDHIHGFYTTASEANDGRYERLYQWALEIACTHCPVLATSQLNTEAEGLQFPSMEKLKGSGTAKQGAASFILMIGRINKIGYEDLRYLSAPKNKHGIGVLATEVMFNRKTARFEIGGNLS